MDDQVLRDAAARYGTPAYVFDLEAFALRIRHMRELLGGRVKLYYAMKANPFLTRTAAAEADGLEICSAGEYAICRRAGIPADKIVLSGVYKERGDVEAVMRERGAGTYTAESMSQLRLLEACAAGTGIGAARVLLRITSGNQFGMDEEMVYSIIKEMGTYPHLKFAGLQYYSGTQKRKVGRMLEELLRLDGFCVRLREELGFEVRELEYGPGFPVPYFEGEAELDEDALLADFTKMLKALEFKGIMVLEMGRFLAAPCGSYLTRVVDVKRNRGQNYCIIDGGINHINYYGQAMAMKVPKHRYLPEDGQASGSRHLPEDSQAPGSRHLPEDGQAPGSRLTSERLPEGKPAPDPETDRWTVCGSLCTSGDILVKNLVIQGPEIGDVLVFERIGAYSVTEGIYLFLSRRLPKILTCCKADGIREVRGDIPTDALNDGTVNSEMSKGENTSWMNY